MNTNPQSVVKSDNLKAFQSGIGSGFDLKIEKQLEQDYIEDFNVIASVNGVYRQETKEYLHQPFQYRVKATGDRMVKVSDGFAVIEAEATPIYPIRLTISKMIAIPVSIQVRVKFKVEYFVKTSSGLEVRNKTLYTAPIVFQTDQNRLSVDNQGTISLEPYTGQEISHTPIRQYIDDAIQNDADVVEAMKYYNITTYGYEIQDDYPFDFGNPYRHQAERTFQSSSIGTFNVTSEYVNGKLDINSTLKVYGVANAGLFYSRENIEKDVSIHDGSKVTLMTFEAFKSMPLVNVDDPTYILTDVIYDSSNPGSVRYHLGQIENPQNFKLYANSYQNITQDDFVVIEPRGRIESNQTTYRFDENESYLNVSYHKLIPTIGKDALDRYHYKLTIVNCSSNIAINNELVRPQQVIRSTGTGVSSFTIVSQFKEQATPWTMTLPNPEHDAPFSGSVNGGNYLINFGKRDYETYIPTFPIPSNVRNARFEIILEGLEEDAPINVRFEKQIRPGVGTENGGQVILSSELFGYRMREFSHTVSQSTLKGFKISGLSEHVYSTTILKENSSSFSYSRFEMELKTDNNDVRITEYPKSVQFQNGEYTFQFKARIQQNAISKWSPRIHNGFYYLNQHEYYMPSRFDAQANYDSGTHFNTEEFKVSLRAEFVKSVADQGLNALLTGEHDYKNSADRFRYFDYHHSEQGEWIHAIPTTQTKYYERYSDLEYISPIKTLDDVVEVWNSISWDEQITASETLSFEARVYDLIKGKWTEWIPILSGGKPNLVPSNLIQFKAKLTFNQETLPVETIVEHWQTAMDYRAIMDAENSSNVTFVDGEVRPLNSLLPAIYCTKVLDYGTAVNLSVNYSSRTGIVNCCIGSSQDASSLSRVDRLPVYSKGSKINQFRYHRIKFEISPEDSLYQVTTAIEITPLREAYIRFGNIEIDGVRRSESSRYTALDDYRVSLKMDGMPHELLPDIETVINECVAGTEFTAQDLYYYQFTSTKTQVELTYSPIDIKQPLVGQSIKSQINESHAPMVRFENNQTIIESTPEQFSPIIVEHEQYGPLREVFFLDGEEPSLDYQEEITLPSTNRVLLKHGGIDQRTLVVQDVQSKQLITNWKIEGSYLIFEEVNPVQIRLTYRLRNSFVALISEKLNQTLIKIHTDKPLDSNETLDKAYVSFETNIVSNKRVLSHLSFNPLYNTQYEGFVYLSNDVEPVKSLKVLANPTVFKPRQVDHTTIYVQALDRYGNPVPGELIQVSETVGTIESVQHVTDQNGVAVFRYHSPKGLGYEVLTFETASKVQEKLTIRIENPNHRRM